ncbi:MAG: hypothetical protein M1829_004244 [Trizodia sp. TS-e1964]|nr:MAG: hypothetical protein M1829_004244 [Trizodia sp. TS-e1964]
MDPNGKGKRPQRISKNGKQKAFKSPVVEQSKTRGQKRLPPPSKALPAHQEIDLGVVSEIGKLQRSHISSWAETALWPKVFYQENPMAHLFVRKAPGSSPTPQESGMDTNYSPNVMTKNEKNLAYKSPLYRSLALYITEDHELGITGNSEKLCKRLLETEHKHPKVSFFKDEKTFQKAFKYLKLRNDFKVIQFLGQLLVPSAEAFVALYDDSSLSVLRDSANEGWGDCIPVTCPRPQPDYSVGFDISAFSEAQREKLRPALGELLVRSRFMATHYICFPFLTCEVKCAAGDLEIADRQNSHSLSLAVRGIFELFKLADRELELHREILTFSISHDNCFVRLYGYYPVFDGSKYSIHRRLVDLFSIMVAKNRWTAYNFTIQAYYEALDLLKKIHSVIDGLPANFKLAAFKPVAPPNAPGFHSPSTKSLCRRELRSRPVCRRRLRRATRREIRATCRPPTKRYRSNRLRHSHSPVAPVTPITPISKEEEEEQEEA